MALKTVPPAAPTGAIAPNAPIEIFLNFPGGNVFPIKATALGTMNAPPIPVKPLNKLKVTISFANPEASDQTTHHTAPASKIFLCP
jgi:hypothetical protein